jgi:hypothetical protein
MLAKGRWGTGAQMPLGDTRWDSLHLSLPFDLLAASQLSIQWMLARGRARRGRNCLWAIAGLD